MGSPLSDRSLQGDDFISVAGGMFRRLGHPRCKGATQNQHAPAVEHFEFRQISHSAALPPATRQKSNMPRKKARAQPEENNTKGEHTFFMVRPWRVNILRN